MSEQIGDGTCEDNGTRQTPPRRYCLRDLHTVTSEKCEKACPKKTQTVHLGSVG